VNGDELFRNQSQRHSIGGGKNNETSAEQKAEFALYGIADTTLKGNETQQSVHDRSKSPGRRPFDEDLSKVPAIAGIGGDGLDVGSFFTRKSQGGSSNATKVH